MAAHMEAFENGYGLFPALEGSGEAWLQEPDPLDFEDPGEPPHHSFESGHRWRDGDAYAVGFQDARDCWRDTGLQADQLAVSRNKSNGGIDVDLQQHKWINRQVTQSSGNMQWLLQTISYHLIDMNPINLATALHRVTKLVVSEKSGYTVERLLKEPCFKQLFSTVAQKIETCAAVAPEGQPRTPLFDVHCMSIVCWSCATLRLAEQQLLCTIAGIARPRLSEFKSFELSNLIWAYAKLSFGLCVGSQLFTAVSKHVMQRKTDDFSLQSLSMVVWSFATAKQKQMSMFQSLAVEIHSKAADAKPQEIANILWAFAKSQAAEVPLFNRLADAALAGNLLGTFKPQELSNTIWAFATVALHHAPLFASLVEAVMSGRGVLSPQNTANILWAYSKLEVDDEQTWQMVSDLIDLAMQRLAQHKPQEISAIIWAASWYCPDRRRFFEAAAAICAHRLHAFPPSALAYMLEAYASIEQGAPASAFSNALVRQSLGRLHQFDLSALTHLLAGLAQLAQSPQGSSQAERWAEHVPFSEALWTVCACIAGRTEDMPVNELALLRLSLERCASPGPAVEELLRAVAAAELRRSRLRSDPACNAKCWPAQRATFRATAHSGDTLGEIPALRPAAPWGPSLPWPEPQGAQAQASRPAAQGGLLWAAAVTEEGGAGVDLTRTAAATERREWRSSAAARGPGAAAQGPAEAAGTLQLAPPPDQVPEPCWRGGPSHWRILQL
ncbi:unnamed protein product [Prorocentrum cordatum]|uniref:RNA-editing substrate-binding complex 6 protein domain-containing protein n=1 Tax=Prorocentrum cordatum TaxID=2364126 RepID=A0ABN9QQ60_9DINO|nr:unnamed protein product [Polarella glacialis]